MKWLFKFFRRIFGLVFLLVLLLAGFLFLTGRMNEAYLSYLKGAFEKAVNEGDFSELSHFLEEENNANKSSSSTEENNESENTEEEEDITDENSFIDYTAKVSFENSRNQQESHKDGKYYHFKYIYRDPRNRPTAWKWKFPKKPIEDIANSYGLPKNFFNTYYTNKEMKKVLDKAMFRSENGMVSADYNSIVAKSQAFARPMYDMLLQKLGKNASQFDLIDETMKFCQDIPYKLPPNYYQGRDTWGYFPPSICLTEGYADCDSKCVLLSSILSHNKNIDIVYVTVPGHLLLGIRGIPNAYQQYITYQGQKYILCEPVGPARLAFGTPGSDYGRVEKIEKVEVR